VQNYVTLVVSRRLFRREKARLHVTCRVKYLRRHITRLSAGDDETPRRRVRHLAACWTRQRRPVDIVNSDTRVPVPSAAPRRLRDNDTRRRRKLNRLLVAAAHVGARHSSVLGVV